MSKTYKSSLMQTVIPSPNQVLVPKETKPTTLALLPEKHYKSSNALEALYAQAVQHLPATAQLDRRRERQSLPQEARHKQPAQLLAQPQPHLLQELSQSPAGSRQEQQVQMSKTYKS